MQAVPEALQADHAVQGMQMLHADKDENQVGQLSYREMVDAQARKMP
jgi:hypothetical protein